MNPFTILSTIVKLFVIIIITIVFIVNSADGQLFGRPGQEPQNGITMVV